MSDRILNTLRAIAWENAKAALRSMLVTYYDNEGEYDELREAIEDFVKKVEDMI